MWLADAKLTGMSGFLTREIRENGRRVGFEILGLAGKRYTLAHRDVVSDKRVGKYGVNVDAVDNIVKEELNNPHTQIVIIDEIGKMELLSENFRIAVSKIWQSDLPVVATIMKTSNDFCNNLKEAENTTVVEIRQDNRKSVFDTIRNFAAVFFVQ